MRQVVNRAKAEDQPIAGPSPLGKRLTHGPPTRARAESNLLSVYAAYHSSR
jgi:hypothetical protein